MVKECLIVVASFGHEYLDGLLQSIKDNTTDVDYAIQVVDNHKDDEKIENIVEPICTKHNVALYLNRELTGYGDVLNTGAEVGEDAKYILYIDSDTKVSKGWLRELIDCYERHEVEGCKAVGPLVKDFNDNYLPGVYELYGKPEEIIGHDLELARSSSYMIGVCILRRKDTIKDFKWDKNFFRAYWEDNDISEQLKFWGYKMFIAGNSLMYHKVNSSHPTIEKETGLTASHIGAANRAYYHQKWDNIYKHKKEILENDIRRFTTGDGIRRAKPQ